MLTPLLAIAVSLLILVWSADKFVDGSAALARHFGISPLFIGMVIVGFGTSAPEMAVSALASIEGNPGIALGNAYGSNICNIALILGTTALITPIAVHSQVLHKELPILIAVTAFAAWQLLDGEISTQDAVLLLAVFSLLMVWAAVESRKQKGSDALGSETEEKLAAHAMSRKQATFWMVVGLVVLIASSRLLVWGAVEIARSLGVGELIIGLTIVAVGTSLPEFASSIIAARKGEDDIALGNIIGSNLFNTLVVVGIAGIIHPIPVPEEVIYRDIPVMAATTLALLVFCFGFGGKTGKITRSKGAILLAGFISYTAWLIAGSF
jgi:cation:H+ antiporter